MRVYKIHMLWLPQYKNEKPKYKLYGIFIAHMIPPPHHFRECIFFVSHNMRYKERSRNVVVSWKKNNNNTDRIAAALCADGQRLKTIVQKGKVSEEG